MVKKVLTSPRPKPIGTELLFSEFAKSRIAMEMARRQISYRELTELYNAKFGRTGMSAETEGNMRNKVSRGTFSAVFLLMVMAAMDCKAISLSNEELALAGIKLPIESDAPGE